MSNCCDTPSNFPNAGLMQQLSTNFPVVWEEICMIQQSILAASSACQPGGGKMSVTVAGNTPMTFLTGVTGVTVVNGGAGYFQDEPSVIFIPPRGASSASGATAEVITNGSSILSVDMITGGTGYQPISSTMSVTSTTGSNALLAPLVNSSGEIVAIDIINSGAGYTELDSIVAYRAVEPNIAYVNAVFRISAVSLTGEILEIEILNPGSGYEDSVTTMEIVSSLNQELPYPLGSGFFGTPLIDESGSIIGVQVNNTGAGYAVYPPYLVITDIGTGARTQATLSNTSVASISVLSSGNQYTQSAVGNVLNPPTATPPHPPSSTAAQVTIQVAENTFGTNPPLYWQVWTGGTINKPIETQLNSVISYFRSLGYTVLIQTNPLTGSTLQWKLFW